MRPKEKNNFVNFYHLNSLVEYVNFVLDSGNNIGKVRLFKLFMFGVTTAILFSFSFSYGNIFASESREGTIDNGNITWIITDDTLTINGSGKIPSYVHDWDDYKYQIKKVIINEGVTEVGSSCFNGFKTMVSISLPSSLAVIGNNSFNGCSSLKSIDIPENVKIISESTFCRCVNLESISFSNEITEIGAFAFYYCRSLKGTITIPDTCTKLGYASFEGCIKIEEIVFPKTITSIPERMCSECKSLKSLKIPNSVSVIKNSAFSECEALETLDLGSGIEYIEDLSFRKCISLKKVIMPDSLKITGSDSFSECESLEYVYLSKNLETLGAATFYGCSSLKNLEIPISVKRIGYSLFEIYGALNNIYYSGTKEQWNEIDIYDDSWLKEVEIFYETEFLHICKEYAQIDYAVLPTCELTGKTEGLHCLVCNKIIEEQSVIQKLEHYWDEGEITIPATCTKEGVKTFRCKRDNCNGIKTEPVKAIGHKWDAGKITKEPTETEKGIKTFTCFVCNETKTEELPVTGKKENPEPEQPGVGTISADGKILTDTDGTKYFVSAKLKANQIKKNISVADKKSNGKYKITKVIKKKGKIVGGNVTYMAPYNKNCTKATAGATVKLGGVKFNITAVNANAFKNCKKLTTFKAGGNVTTIGKNAFNGCSNLKSVTIISTKLKSIGTGAFKGTTAKTKYKVPKSKLSKYSKMIYKAGANKKAKITK